MFLGDACIENYRAFFGWLWGWIQFKFVSVQGNRWFRNLLLTAESNRINYFFIFNYFFFLKRGGSDDSDESSLIIENNPARKLLIEVLRPSFSPSSPLPHPRAFDSFQTETRHVWTLLLGTHSFWGFKFQPQIRTHFPPFLTRAWYGKFPRIHPWNVNRCKMKLRKKKKKQTNGIEINDNNNNNKIMIIMTESPGYRKAWSMKTWHFGRLIYNNNNSSGSSNNKNHKRRGGGKDDLIDRNSAARTLLAGHNITQINGSSHSVMSSERRDFSIHVESIFRLLAFENNTPILYD